MVKVLIVDDYEGIRNMLNSILSGLDCKVESVENAKEGLEKFTGKDVVFIDFAKNLDTAIAAITNSSG